MSGRVMKKGFGSLTSSRELSPSPAGLAMAVLLLCAAAGARAQPARLSCGISQLTSTQDELGGSIPAAIDYLGSGALLFSTQALPGSKSTGSLELFLMNLENGEFSQLTNVGDFSTFRGRISANGDLSRVVFRSSSDLTGENPGLHTQLFLLDTKLLQFHQLTQAESDILEAGPDPLITGNGRKVVFSSSGNPVELNADQSVEVFSLDLETQELRQLTDLSQASEIRGFAASHDGNLVVSHLFHPLSAFSEIVLAQFSSDSRRVVINGRNIALPLLSGDGKQLFFVGRGDFTHQNPDGGAEIFSLRTDAASPLLTLAQLTDFPARESSANPLDERLQIQAVGLSRDGSRLAFRSPSNLLGIAGDPDSSLYVLDVATRGLNQFPLAGDEASDNFSARLFLDQTGQKILTGSQGNPAGENADGNRESFLASCEPARIRYLPQVGSGIVFDLKLQTSIMFAATDAPIVAQIEFFDQMGAPLTIDLGDAGTGSFFSRNLNRGRSWTLETNAGGNRNQILVGWARVSTGTGLNGTGIFSGIRNSTGTFLYEAAVPLMRLLTEFSILITHRVDLKTGLAVVNPGDRSLSGNTQSAAVVMRLYDSDFRLLGEVTTELADGGHRAQFVDQIFQGVAQMDLTNAMLTVHSSEPLAAVALRQRDDPYREFPDDVPTLTTFPVAPGAPDDPPEQAKIVDSF